MNLFERLAKGRPAEPAIEQPPSDAQKLLDWLLKWPKPTVRMNEILVFGPRSMRKRQIAITAAEVLVEHQWLTQLQTRRPDMIEWQITRRPIVHPTIAT